MAISSIMDAGVLTIIVEGRFDFSAHQLFRGAYEGLEKRPDSYVIEMSAATYLDSSALGMLLLLKDFAGGDDAKISLDNCSDDVKKILSIANFEQLFVIR